MTLRRVVLRVVVVFFALLGSGLAVVLPMGCRAFGKGADGDRLLRMETSPRWDEDHFANPLPLYTNLSAMWDALFHGGDVTAPEVPFPLVHPRPEQFAELPVSGLRITWLGHSTLLIEIDGKRILTDPVWGPRASPFTWVGPKRWYPPLIELEKLPPIDIVAISHDHYDHLDYPTIERMHDWNTQFVTPLGVGAHLEYWGVPLERITELDWWQEKTFGDVKLVCSPARHASGRHLFDRDRTLWAGYAMIGPKHRVYFSGDTGLFPEFSEIGEKYGPFDVTMVEVGAYNQAWPDWHSGPEQAVQAHQMLRGTRFLPIHWGLFTLASHNWTEPMERTVVAAERASVSVLTPKPGESVEPATAVTGRWWPSVAWKTAEEDPIKATGMP
jgi:L-ascorbate metabolism protein UlaG (beta-lactamase superfamily)